jgi:hypothetical protein
VADVDQYSPQFVQVWRVVLKEQFGCLGIAQDGA